jgi:mitogen-activated protein kinase 1/3
MAGTAGINLREIEQETRGQYHFVKVLGRGAYGIVLQANERSTGRPVAVKRVDRIFQSVLDAKRILREIRVLSRLKHENIANLLDVTASLDPSHFQAVVVVMDLMDTDMFQILSSGQTLLVDHHRYFIYQLLRGLKYIHSGNVLHRDLKPANLLLNANCDLKICDFGLARVANVFDDLSEYVATRWYRAPEVLLNYPTYGTPIDVWSVGCILAELMLRRPLLPGQSTMNQLAIMNDVLGSPTEEDLEQCSNPKARRFMSQLPAKPVADFQTLFPGADPDEIDLTRRMLTWDPRNRITVEEALEHAFLAQLHDPFDEPVTFPIPDFEFETPEFTMDALRELIWKEIVKFHPEYGE